LKEGVATLGRRAKPEREGRKEGKFYMQNALIGVASQWLEE